MRFGQTIVPRPGNVTDTIGNPRPGMGLKFLRDGRDSANLVAMVSLSGQQSWNFLEKARDISTLFRLIARKSRFKYRFISSLDLRRPQMPREGLVQPHPAVRTGRITTCV